MPARGRRDFDLTSRVSFKAACLGLAFHVALLYAEETGVNLSDLEVEVSIQGRTCDVVLHARGYEDLLDSILEALRVVVGSAHLPLRVSYGDVREPLRVVSIPQLVASMLVESYASKLLEVSKREGYECFLVVGWNGLAVGGIGYERRVELPSVKALAVMHTHDLGCLPSPEDLKAASEFFAEGGLVDVVVGPGCALALYVESPFTVEDYEVLSTVARRLKRVADESEYLTMLLELERRSCVRILMRSV